MFTGEIDMKTRSRGEATAGLSDSQTEEGVVFFPARQWGPQMVLFFWYFSFYVFKSQALVSFFFFWALIVRSLPLSTTGAAAAAEATRRDPRQQTWFRAEWQSMWHIQQAEMFILNVSAAQKSPW